jgi:hypothetical protein
VKRWVKKAQVFSRQYHLITRENRLDKIAEDGVRHFAGHGHRGKLLLGPIACVYARCRIREMGEGFLDQRDLKIMATTVVSCRR